MAKFTEIQNATIVSSVTSTGSFFTARINSKNVGLPIYTFEDPSIDLLPVSPNFILSDSTLHDSGTSYDLGIAYFVNNSAVATPLFIIDQVADDIPNLTFNTPTLVSNLTSTGDYLVINLEEHNYGIPLYTYSAQYVNGVVVEPSNIKIETVVNVGRPTLDLVRDSGSTYLNPKLEAYSDVIRRIKGMLGFPTINVDVCDEVISDFIDTALELYTKYAGYTEEFLMFNTSIYKRGVGVKMDQLFTWTPEMFTTNWWNASGSFDYDLNNYRKVIDVWSFEQGEATGVNTLFTLEQAMAQQTYFSYMLGSAGFDLITWEILKGWLDTRQKVLAQIPYIRFDPKTQILKILPEPMCNQNYYCVVGCYVENAIKHLISEPWIYMYTLALVKLNIGHIRGKYSAQQLFGGGVLNYNDIMAQGLKEKEELEKQLFTGTGFVDSPQPRFFIG
jgi:hypothetical protein